MDGYKIVAGGQRITFTWEHVRQGRCGRSGDAS